jgi:undecaprenyl-diphosphatase
MNLIGTFLRDNWRLFTEVNGMAGHERLLDPLMVLGANDLIFLLPLLLLGLWFAYARWAPWARRAGVGAGTPAFDAPARRLSQQMALIGCAAVVLAAVISTALGAVLYEPRPFVSHPGTVHLLIAHPADTSFPSDHVAVASAIASTLVLYLLLAAWGSLRRRATAARQPRGAPELRLLVVPLLLALCAVLAVVMIGVARVYVGVHYPADIVGGVGCGMLAAFLLTALRPWIQPLLDLCVRVAERVHLA